MTLVMHSTVVPHIHNGANDFSSLLDHILERKLMQKFYVTDFNISINFNICSSPTSSKWVPMAVQILLNV